MNTNTQTVDERCAKLASEAMMRCGLIHRTRVINGSINPALASGNQSGMFEVRELADRIIAERTAEAAREVQS